MGGAFDAAADGRDCVEADADVIEVVVVELNEVDEVEAAVVAGSDAEES